MTPDPKLPFPTESAIDTSTEGSSQDSPGNGTSSAPGVARARRRSAAHVWLRRAGVLLFVFLCATLGVMLMILPWSPEWSDNRLLLPYPGFRQVVSSGFVRGVVTGLGLLNVWIGFWEAIQYRED